MNIGSIKHTYQQNSMEDVAKLPTGGANAKKAVGAFEKVIVDINNSGNRSSVQNGMEELKKGISSVEEQLQADAKAAKGNLKALFNKLSGAEAVKLDEDGFDINDMDEEELVTVVDRIKLMLAAYNENYQALSLGADAPSEESLEESGVALSAKVAAQLEKAQMPATEENINEVASTLEMAKDVAEKMPLSEEAKAYMIDHQLDATVENVYRANHSTVHHGYRGGITEDQWNQVKTQVAGIMKNAGIPETEESFANARWLIQNELPVTADNLLKKEELDALTFDLDEEKVLSQAVSNLASGEGAGKIYLNGEENVWKTAAKAIAVVQQANESHVDSIVNSGRRLTIEELANEIKSANTSTVDITKNNIENSVTNDVANGVEGAELSDKTYHVEAYRSLYEARIMMTATSTVTLIQQGIDIYAEDLPKLVDMLHETQNRWIQEQLTKQDARSISEADLAAVSNVQNVLAGLAFAPAATIGALALGNGYAVESRTVSITITSVQMASSNMQRQYEQAGEAYETMSTKARSDMGDSVVKALRNSSESILNELSMEVNENNLRAVRILAYNQMEMSTDNIMEVRNLDSMLNNLMDHMQPQVVYNMIKDGLNPMETDIETLNQYLTEHYEISSETVKYSEFLYSLEQNDAITPQERKQYVGIYKMLHTLKKDGGKAVGALFNQDAELNLKNLMMAVDSRKQYGMDVTMDENKGMNQGKQGSRYYENLFSELAENITPGALKKASLEGENLDAVSPEHLNELMEQYREEDREIRKQYMEEQVSQARDLQNVEDQVMRLLTDNQVPVSFYNLAAAQELMGKNSIFQRAFGEKNNSVEREALHMMDALESKETMDEELQRIEELVETEQENALAMEDATDSYLDINMLKNFGKSVHLMRELGGKQQYFIPFETENGIANINLKVIRTAEHEGRMEMRFTTERLGNVYAQLHVTEQRATGYIASDEASGVEFLKEQMDTIMDAIRNLGIEETDINVGAGMNVPQMNLASSGEGAPAPLIYRTAKAILQNLTRMS